MDYPTSSRRSFLKTTSAASLGFLGLYQFVNHPLLASPGTPSVGYGELLKDPQGILNLPKGFSYRIISRQGDRMADGLLVPARPDGMATFRGRGGRVILVRNHENGVNLEHSAFGKQNELLGRVDRAKFYDYGKGVAPQLGGTTTVVYNERTGQVEVQYLSLAGTARNCAGGRTPWGTWITCEENTERAGANDGKTEQDHGYNFEVRASEKPFLADPLPLRAMGRFNHEAVCVDPRTKIVYQTEDRPDGLIYRFLPNQGGQLAKGGKLQALAVKGQKSLDTRNWERLTTPKLPVGQKLEVEWLDMDQVEAPKDDLRYRGFEQGAARFARGEGMWFGQNEVYFACTNGGQKEQGQVFRYRPSAHEGTPRERDAPATLEIFAEPNNSDIMKSCDNLTVAPWGDVVLCEDHPHSFLVGITPQGELYRLAENVGFQSEMAGGVFSPSGKTFFVNIQEAGVTLAISGPWKTA
jgi:uncharacterized protein